MIYIALMWLKVFTKSLKMLSDIGLNFHAGSTVLMEPNKSCVFEYYTNVYAIEVSVLISDS